MRPAHLRLALGLLGFSCPAAGYAAPGPVALRADAIPRVQSALIEREAPRTMAPIDGPRVLQAGNGNGNGNGNVGSGNGNGNQTNGNGNFGTGNGRGNGRGSAPRA